MIVRKAAFVSEISGYGSFKVKDPVFKPDESQMIYLEPVAFSYGKTSEGGAIASWSVDYSLTGKAIPSCLTRKISSTQRATDQA